MPGSGNALLKRNVWFVIGAIGLAVFLGATRLFAKLDEIVEFYARLAGLVVMFVAVYFDQQARKKPKQTVAESLRGSVIPKGTHMLNLRVPDRLVASTAAEAAAAANAAMGSAEAPSPAHPSAATPEPQRSADPSHARMLNKKQLVCLWAGIAVFVLLALAPPWYQHAIAECRIGDQPLGHAPLFSPPAPLSVQRPSKCWTVRVDGIRLILEWSVVAAITAGLLLTLRGRKASS
jgi:hypothetical protein